MCSGRHRAWGVPFSPFIAVADLSEAVRFRGTIALAGGVDLAEEGFIGIAYFLDLVRDVGRGGRGRGGSGGGGFVVDPTEAVSWRQRLPAAWLWRRWIWRRSVLWGLRAFLICWGMLVVAEGAVAVADSGVLALLFWRWRLLLE